MCQPIDKCDLIYRTNSVFTQHPIDALWSHHSSQHLTLDRAAAFISLHLTCCDIYFFAYHFKHVWWDQAEIAFSFAFAWSSGNNFSILTKIWICHCWLLAPPSRSLMLSYPLNLLSDFNGVCQVLLPVSNESFIERFHNLCNNHFSFTVQ